MLDFFHKTFTDPIILTIVSIQFIWAAYAVYQLFKLRDIFGRKSINYYSFESIPSTFVTIGLFGTCLGIAIGLYKFDISPENIKGSVQQLLSGLKSAFFVTILGLFLSLVFKYIINYSLHKYSDIQPPDSPELDQLKELNKNLKSLGADISDSFKSKFDVFIKDMQITNQRLIERLDGFAENLADQNQSALMEALEGVVKELNSGFREVLGELVKQNFKELTDSVSNLNRWQQQNKIQVDALIEAYTSLVTNTQKLDGILTSIISKNEQLIGQNSKLHQLIDTLNKVIVNDEKFVEIINQLNKSAENVSTASTKYIDSLSEINNWFKQENGIKESILLLNQQLSKIEDAPTFNNRLSTTFSTLDKIMSTYFESLPRIIEKHIENVAKNK